MNILVSKDGGVELLSALPATSALSIHTDTNKPQQSCLANLIIWGLMGASLLTLPLSCYAAISATTTKTIHGTAPYLTLNGGVTKVTTTDALLGITISDGTPAGTITYTKSTNTSSLTSPIELPVAGQTFDDVLMLVPPTAPPVSATDPAQIVNLTDVIGAPYNYWGDDDGDGQGASGITATGTLKVEIKDKYGQAVNRSDTLSICNAPYQVKLTSTAGTLKTQYGDPSQSNFTGDNTTYYINPKSPPVVCYARPDMFNGTGQYAGPAYMWNPTKGYIPQSTTPATYGLNFPTTGANNLSFELDIGGAPSALTWTTAKASATPGDITATPSACATPSNSCVKYTLTGPAANATQQTQASPGAIAPVPTLNTPLVLEGQVGGTTVVKYGFVIKQWFINRGSVMKPATTTVGADTQPNWCASIGYQMPTVAELTNASGGAWPAPSNPSGGNNYTRHIGGGLFTEWGNMDRYTGAGFVGVYWTSDTTGTFQFRVYSYDGAVYSRNPVGTDYGVCTLP